MDSIKEILKQSDLFEGLSDDELDKLLPLCREEVYEARTILFSEGEPCHTMYIVGSGKVALELKLQISRATEESATTQVVTKNGCLCCSGLIDPFILTATGRTLEKTEVIALGMAELKGLLAEDISIGFKTMNNLGKVISSRFEYTRKTMGHILSVIFHDLKSPLAAVESYNRVMLGGFAGGLNDEQKNMLERSSKRLSELLNLVSNMIDVSRIDTKDLKMSEISLAQVVKDSVEAMLPLAEEKEIKLKAEVPEESFSILGAKERLKQVVVNLLTNGIKFTPPGGSVTVKLKDDTDYVQVEVTDTGIGIPSEELPKIFDDYYRGLSSLEKGAGLGLSISKSIVEAHGGGITAVSPCPESGKGSKFIFTLPRASKLVKRDEGGGEQKAVAGGINGEGFNCR